MRFNWRLQITDKISDKVLDDCCRPEMQRWMRQHMGNAPDWDEADWLHTGWSSVIWFKTEEDAVLFATFWPNARPYTPPVHDAGHKHQAARRRRK